ncbi:hypothetical protein ANO11243_076500 [Dothideomycetidae sp. 11243]|nr:hypothetical protein ANO11243_076500 [fungal sp. No.11243]
MPSPFEAKKSKILSQLSTPSDAYTDLSPKGSVDLPIRSLVDEINALPSLVTTSSCSGRLAIYAEGLKPSTSSSANAQGKGSGGAWLFVSHSPVPVPPTLSSLLSSSENETPSSIASITPRSTAFGPQDRLIRLKFEPLILHVLCADSRAARALLAAAQGAGFRESGVSSLPAPPPTNEGREGERKYPRRERRPRDESVMLAIRTTGLALDAPVAVVGGTEGVEQVVSDAYVAGLVGVANERFVVNEERKRRLAEGIRRAFAGAQEEATIAQGDDRDDDLDDGQPTTTGVER